MPITRLLHRFVKITVITMSMRQKVAEDIFWKIGPKITFRNAEIPVDSFVSTLPNRMADVHKKNVGHAKLDITFPNGRTGVESPLFKFTQARTAVYPMAMP